MNLKCLFLINGAGLGNSVRMLPIINAFEKKGIKCIIACSGKAASYFSYHKKNYFLLQQLEYGVSKENLDIIKTFSYHNICKNIAIFKKNNALINNIINCEKPDLCFIDSFYNIKNIKKHNIPIYALNNSDLLFNNSSEYLNKMDFKTKLHFLSIEQSDYYFHNHYVKKIFSPTFFKSKKSNKIVHIPVIAKSNINEYQGEENNVMLMFSGSCWKNTLNIHSLSNTINKLFIIGIKKENLKIDNINNAHIIGTTYDNSQYINNSKVAVINAGFSAISEMIKTKKPMVIIPIQNHSEQMFNALKIEEMGLGIIANENNWQEKCDILLKNYSFYKNNFNNIEIPSQCNEDIIVNEILKDF